MSADNADVADSITLVTIGVVLRGATDITLRTAIAFKATHALQVLSGFWNGVVNLNTLIPTFLASGRVLGVEDISHHFFIDLASFYPIVRLVVVLLPSAEEHHEFLPQVGQPLGVFFIHRSSICVIKCCSSTFLRRIHLGERFASDSD